MRDVLADNVSGTGCASMSANGYSPQYDNHGACELLAGWEVREPFQSVVISCRRATLLVVSMTSGTNSLRCDSRAL